ncbi:MAG: DUF4258 domain-containing protein [Planctomycetota bacterium]
MTFHISRHANEQIRRRGIPPGLLDSVLQQPQQIVPQPDGNNVYQSQLDFGSGQVYLLRAVVNDAVEPPVVVTVYRTSNISKYWRTV